MTSSRLRQAAAVPEHGQHDQHHGPDGQQHSELPGSLVSDHAWDSTPKETS